MYLRRHLSDYVHELQKVVAVNPDWDRDRIDRQMQQRPLCLPKTSYARFA